jgi:hypothetical protein
MANGSAAGAVTAKTVISQNVMVIFWRDTPIN